MPASTLTKHRATVRSTVVLKAIMAITGLVMIGFLLAHMAGNLWVFAGREEFNDYAHHLRTLGEPMLPHKVLLWALRIGLLLSVVLHVYSAITLWKRAHVASARKGGTRYHTSKGQRGVQRSYASFTMRYGGIVITLFVIYHLLHFTGNQIHPGGASSSPYDRVVNGFEIWWVWLSYVIAMVAIGLHLRHGLWAAAASLGANTSPRRRRQLNTGAITIAVVITVGFLLPPTLILFGGIS
ncbi:MAG: succinate dehydrogenase subunit [Thermoleophilia bacterium]|nr:succinate dehydrogenase subunit [Thermoleophilia bacterium]